MPEVLDAPADIASVPETPELDAPETPEIPLDSPEAADSDQADADAPVTPEDRVTSQKPVYDPDTKKLDPEVKKALDALHATDPKTAARIRNTLARGEALRAELPGGVQEARQLKALVEEAGGEDGIRELREGNEQFDALGKQFKTGDPAFVADLIETDLGGFCKMMTTAYAKWSEADPDGFASTVSSTILQHMAANRVENRLDFLEFALSDVPNLSPKVVENLKGLRDYFNALNQLAQKPAITPRAAPPAPDNREVTISQKEKELQMREWSTRRDQMHAQVFENNLKTLTGGKELSKESKSAVVELYKSAMSRALTPKIRADLQKRMDNGDDKGYLRAVQAFYNDNSQKALKQALSHVRWDNGKANSVAATPRPQGVAAPPKPNNGYKWRNTVPTQAEMSPRTTGEMIKKGWAILTDGSKVQWKKF